jgi:hyperosmotically inducible periplasmic protein
MFKLIFLVLMLAIVSFTFAVEGEYDEVAKRIEQKIRSEDKIKIDHLKVMHNNDIVYMEGVTKDFGSKYLAEKIASEEKGVTKVDNQIAVSTAQVPDEEIQTDLVSRIGRVIRNEPFDLISVKSTGGFITLTGFVRDTSLVDKAFEEAIQVPGVRGVENKIQVATPSSEDDRLRLIILRLLKAQFPRYFVGRPSILILVDSGRVTLVGSMSSNVEKEKMLSSVRSVPGVISVQDQLQIP